MNVQYVAGINRSNVIGKSSFCNELRLQLMVANSLLVYYDRGSVIDVQAEIGARVNNT